MSEESALSFRKLVSAMRTTEKEYWAHRDKKMLRQSIELEKRVDDIILKADGSAVPQNDNGTFFLLVAELRASTIQYFQEKKKAQPDKELSTPSSRPSRRKKPSWIRCSSASKMSKLRKMATASTTKLWSDCQEHIKLAQSSVPWMSNLPRESWTTSTDIPTLLALCISSARNTLAKTANLYQKKR